MAGSQSFFEKAAVSNGPVVKSGLCSICKGAHRLCGKDRCPLIIKFSSPQRTRTLIDSAEIAGYLQNSETHP